MEKSRFAHAFPWARSGLLIAAVFAVTAYLSARAVADCLPSDLRAAERMCQKVRSGPDRGAACIDLQMEQRCGLKPKWPPTPIDCRTGRCQHSSLSRRLRSWGRSQRHIAVAGDRPLDS